MRVFIAIDIDDVTRGDLADLQSELQAKADIGRKDAKWVDPRNVHARKKAVKLKRILERSSQDENEGGSVEENA